MSLLNRQLITRRYQKKLGLTDKTTNALNRKHNNKNFIKQLQILNPKTESASAPPPPPPAPTASITTSNPNIQGGGSTTIIPVFTNATTKTINGETTQYGQPITSTIPITVNPITTTTFTLVVTNSAGVIAQASVTIYVAQPPPPEPTASITTSNPNIGTTTSTTITPLFTNGTTVTINGGITVQGQPITSNVAITVNPTTTTTYTLVVTNSAGVTRQASVTINVSTGFNGNITINHTGDAYQMFLMVRADGTQRYNQSPVYFTTTTFSIGAQLASTSSFLYMYAETGGRYAIDTSGFITNGVTYHGYENIGGTFYQKYSVASSLTNSTLVYNVTTYFND
jgi:hypothetical protein